MERAAFAVTAWTGHSWAFVLAASHTIEEATICLEGDQEREIRRIVERP